MKKYYLLFAALLLMQLRAMPQGTEVYAAAHKPIQARKQGNSNPLKQALAEVERSFQISIAYKDEWIENKQVYFSPGTYSVPEQALDSLLKDTDLYYEKAGDRFYVIHRKQSKLAKAPQSAAISAAPMLLNTAMDFSSLLEPTFASLEAIELPLAVEVTGTVRDENGQTFPGVNVVIKGTSIGTTTDTNGKYTLNVEDDNATLVFSFVGYTTQEIALAGRSVIDLTMAPDVQALEEVVVTALGIQRSARSLGYATSKVNSDQLTINRSPNLMNTLQGKVAGLNISSLGTGPGGSSKIRIRGQSSISGQNNPLIVINGVPIDNTNFGTKLGNNADDTSIGTRGGGAATDGGDGLSSINPDDVESMQVLKGAAAAALYGSRAKDGVIMITTKSRGTTKGIGVTYNMNYTDETPLDFTDYQYEFGQGENGAGPASPGALPNPNTGQWSFGPRIKPGMTQLLFADEVVPYVAQKGILNQFYRHGTNFSNSVAIAANGEKGGLNISFADLSSKGITPNNEFNRKTVNMGFGYDLSDKLTVKGNINYSFEKNTNPPVVSDQDNSIPTSLYAMANTMPMEVLDRNKFNAVGGEYSYSRFTNRTNPYWVLAKVRQNIRRDRIFGNFSAKYDFTDWLSAQIRGGEDFWTRDQDYINVPTGKNNIAQGNVNSSVPGFFNGVYTQEARRFRETNIDFLITAAKTFSDFGVNVSVGGNQMKRRSDLNSVQVTDFVVRDLYTVQNGRAKDPFYDLSERGVNSLYGQAEVNYKQFLYLNATVRNDWFSTLSPANRSILYPSVSASYVFSESFGTKPGWLDFGKFRAAYAKVGSDTDVPPYANLLFYGVNGNQFGGQAVGNFGGVVPNANLKPMTVAETELGLELKMFDSRVNLDLAVYSKITTDQIVNAQISDGSGFTSTRINSGKSQNKGFEMMVNLIPVTTTNFQWDFTFAGAYNITEVLSLLTEVPGESITVGSHVFNGFVQQIVGEEMGQIVGYGYRRNDEGKIIFGTNGLPLRTTSLIPFGSALPKWVGGFTNAFNYKGITASFLIDFKLGGKVLSGTNFNAYRHGLSKETLPGREGGTLDANGNDPGAVIGDGVNELGEVNTVAAQAENYYSVVRGSQLVEPVIYNAGYWKLRQITIGYDFTKFFNDTSPIKGLRLSFVANNVLMLKKWAPNIDPESFSYTSDNVVGLESPSVPTTRSLGFNLNVKF
ncbi:MAG: SusC/RagA family TonB-linked outer membrane protein [Cyclobacteriaceae bacterium]|nr:SusC/RagA family TonB-linked outer membrane protein [Cyclobacteriaceae bacterium]MDH5251087.1 SusC/RagA family TonB-linked outer membrane protein [Cyclobacteriaceae bacterium]